MSKLTAQHALRAQVHHIIAQRIFVDEHARQQLTEQRAAGLEGSRVRRHRFDVVAVHKKHRHRAFLEPPTIAASEGGTVVGVIHAEECVGGAELLQWPLQCLDARAGAELEVLGLRQSVALPQPLEVAYVVNM